MQDFKSDKEYKDLVLKNTKYMAKAIGSTLGPKGKNVIIKTKEGKPIATKDGITVAKFMKGDTAADDAIIEIIRQASLQTAREAGDGTTSTVILAASLIENGINENWTHIEKELMLEADKICDILKEEAFQIESIEDIKNIATLSANNDPELGAVVAEAVDSVGKNGSIAIQPGSKTGKTYVETFDGFTFESGLFSTRFMTNERRNTAEYNDANLFITDFKLTDLQPLFPMLSMAGRDGKPLIIVADDFDGEVIASFIANQMKSVLKICPIKSPKYGQEKIDFLEDLAAVTGGTFVSRSEFITMKKFEDRHPNPTPALFGKIKFIEVGRKGTNIISGNYDNKKILEKIDYLRSQLKEANEAEGRLIQERITRLASCMSIIFVGGSSEVEIEEKRHRIEDAVEAVKAAQEYGYQIGGSVPLLRALKKRYGPTGASKSAPVLLSKACRSIMLKIAENASYPYHHDTNYNSLIKPQEDNEMGPSFFEIDVDQNHKYQIKFVNYKELGIIEPVKVTLCVLKNAISVASVLLSTGCILTD